MGLLEDIDFKKNYLIYLSIIGLFIFALYLYKKTLQSYTTCSTENMTDLGNIETDPIRNLSALCKSLTDKENIIIPGTINVDAVNIGEGPNMLSISSDNNKNLYIKNGPKDSPSASQIIYTVT